MEKMEKKICGCEDKDHDVCWDGYFTFPDPQCSCCKNTIEQMEDV